MTPVTRTTKKFRNKGFRRVAPMIATEIRKAGESRGFSVSRILTHWDEVAGPNLASVTRPVDVRYGRQGFGATLTVLTTGSMAPMVEMQKEALRERVNQCYGYAAISQIRVTQTAATGFAEGQAQFGRAAKAQPVIPDPGVTSKAEGLADGIDDGALRDALAALGTSILSKSNLSKGKK